MPDGRYKITESVGSRVENVSSYSDLQKHHPSSGREKGRSYTTIDGRLEEVHNTPDGRTLVKKDFILHVDGSAAVDVPSPVGGYVYFDKNFGTAAIYDAPKEQGGKLTAKVLHMDPDTFRLASGSEVSYGQGLGVQGGTGKGGAENKYGIHAHVEVAPEQYAKYIQDIHSGAIRQGHYPTPAPAGQAATAPLLNDPAHPGYSRFAQAYDGMCGIDAQHGRTPDARTANAAGCLAASSVGLKSLNHVVLSDDAQQILGIQGDLNSPHKQVVAVPTVAALNTPIADSSQAWTDAAQAQRATEERGQGRSTSEPAPSLAH